MARRWSRRSRATARSTSARCGGSRGGRSTPASTFSCPCGTTGESPTLTDDERLRVVELVVEEARPRAGPRRRRRLQHAARSFTRARRDEARRRRRHPLGHAVLQQADAGRAVPALQRDRREHVGCRSSSTTCPGRTGCNVEPPTLVAARGDPEHRRREGSVRQHDADVRDLPRGAGRLHRAVGRRCADAAADGGGRPRHHLGGVERDAGGDGADGRGAPSADDFAGARASSTRSCCR